MSLHLSLPGKSGTRAERRLRNGDDVREPVRGGDQGSVGGRRYTGVLRSQTGIPAHGLRQVVSILAVRASAHTLVYTCLIVDREMIMLHSSVRPSFSFLPSFPPFIHTASNIALELVACRVKVLQDHKCIRESKRIVRAKLQLRSLITHCKHRLCCTTAILTLAIYLFLRIIFVTSVRVFTSLIL